MKSKSYPWRTRNLVISDATITKRATATLDRGEVDTPQAAWLRGPAFKRSWVRDADKRRR